MATYDQIQAEVKNNLHFSTSEHSKLLELVRSLFREGQRALDDRIEDMEKADAMYRAFVEPDEDDKEAAKRKEPIKIVYPVTYAQIQSTLSALSSVYHRRPFIELEGRGPDFYRGAKLLELDLQYQLDQIGWALTQYGWHQDMLKYGFGWLNIGWQRKSSYITTQSMMGKLIKRLTGTEMPWFEETKEVIGYEGAEITLQDPFNINFDPNVSIGDIQKAQYIFWTDEMSFNDVLLRAPEQHWFNLEGLEDATKALRASESERRKKITARIFPTTELEGGNPVFIDWCYVKLVPSQYKLSTLNRPQIWKITMANESRIIGAEPSRHEHGMMPVAAIEYLPDKHNTTNDGMAQTIDGLQGWINWLLNSHQAAVRKVINDVLIVDPRFINVDDIINRRPVIQTKPGASGAGLNTIIQQLQVHDVTQTHVADAIRMFDMIQRATGINDNLMGVQADTVRTATEVASVQRLAAGRVRMLAELIFEQGVHPLAKQMVQNTQSFLEQERFLRVTSSLAKQLGVAPDMMGNYFAQSSPETIQGFFDVVISDTTTPPDRMFVAQKLQELMVAALQTPQLIPALGLNIPLMLQTILMNYGIKNGTDFAMPPDPAVSALMAMAGANGAGVQGVVQSPEQVQSQVDAGNLIPAEAAVSSRMNRPQI